MHKVTQLNKTTGQSENMGETSAASWTRPLLAGLLAVAAVTLLVLGIVIGYQLVYANEIYPGVRIGDVKLGGMTREVAQSQLLPLYQERERRPLLIQMAGMDREAKLDSLGATFDAEAAVNDAFAVGRSGSWIQRLAAQLGALTRGQVVESPGIHIDRSKLQSYLGLRAQEVDRPVKDAQVVVGEDLSVTVTPSVIGRKLDLVGSAAAIEKVLMSGADSVTLPVVETQPRRVEKELEEARGKLAKMLSGPVSLQFEGRRWSLGPKEISAMVSVEDRVGLPAPVVSLRQEPLQQMVDRIAGEIDRPKTNARYDWNRGNLKPLRPGNDGRLLDKGKSLATLNSAISSDQRAVALPVEVDKAVGDSIDQSKLGIKELIELATTSFAGGIPEKVHNINLASSRLNGVVIEPGETFSFNKELGPTTLKSGFQTGFGIAVNNGEMQTVPSVAGGICQVATTLLHAVFWSGYQLEERYPHMYWITGYGLPPKGMVGLDATVDDPVLDLKFVNNTQNYVLVGSRVQGSTLEFALYGTKPGWKVEAEGPIITNVVKADQTSVRQEEPTLAEGREIWVERALDGMDVTVIRKVTQGNDVRTLELKSRYAPSRNVLMIGTKKPDPTPTAAPSVTPPVGTPAVATSAPAASPAATATRPATSVSTPTPQSR